MTVTVETGRGVLSHTDTEGWDGQDLLQLWAPALHILPRGEGEKMVQGWWLLYDYNDFAAKDQGLWAMPEREDSWVAEHGGKCLWSQYLRDWVRKTARLGLP